MTDLFEELQAMGEVDEENFIYLNEQGKAELKQELVFKWSQFPSKKIHITCSPSDSISFVKTLLLVAMEKYSIFLSLRNLKIVNIHNSKETLPEVTPKQKGNIGDFIRSEPIFIFDVESSDMWLEVQIDFRDLALVIFFEVKIPNETQVSSFRKFICDLLNHILYSENNSLTYTESDILIQRLKLTDEVILATDLKSSMVTQTSKVRKIKDLNDGVSVIQAFSFINRYTICTPLQGKLGQSGARRKSIIREAYNPTIMQVLQNTNLNFQIRAPRTEAKIFRKSKGLTQSPSEKPLLEAQNSSVCNCSIV